ncbi:hypothetical protein IWQ62_005929 [Dispira parvispora]|uniref:DUF924 domain-containing protein n=1 Tax=Dispira parvispora TaxID=1520584 RepID=A0A9W8AQ28_9FUNG|nr:hypothetical protein IWQ62_005929 [Dispira parvispora]
MNGTDCVCIRNHSKHFKADLDAVVEQNLYVDELKQTPRGTLSLIVLLDQFSRHIYRKNGKAFSGDSKAQALSQWSLEKKFDQELEPLERLFVYMPLVHSESLELHELSVTKFQELCDSCPKERETYGKGVESAVDHRTVISRFGRYPHRNAVLGRTNTAEEEKYLAEGGSFPWEQTA